MQLKRNPISSSNLINSKQSTLIHPLIGISKASTPVRTRIIGSNTTPINQSKINNFHKSPNNKQNFNTNYGMMKTCNPTQPENRINLSPILSINKKIHQGSKLQAKKSLTPEGSKAIEQQDNYGMGLNEKNYQTLNEGKSFNSTNNFTNLRTSNSFKNLIEARCKTPNRFQNQLTKIHDSKGGVKDSLSSNQFFKQLSKQNKPKLIESRSFDRFKLNNQISSSSEAEIKCLNNDGKKAKYRVINEDSDEVNDIPLYYCSICTIPLVQQGFIVEQIGKEVIRQSKNDKNIVDYQAKLQSKKNYFQFLIKQINKRQNESNLKLNNYYDQVISYIQQKRDSQRVQIDEYYKQKKLIPLRYLQETSNIIKDINCGKNNKKYTQIEKILSYHQNQILQEPSMNVQQLLNHFKSNFTQNIWNNTINQNQKKACQNSNKASQQINNRNHAMRFSFQKLLTNIHHKKGNMQSVITPLEEQEEQQENENVNVNVNNIMKEGHTAFRDLFPEVNEATNNGIYSPTFKNF